MTKHIGSGNWLPNEYLDLDADLRDVAQNQGELVARSIQVQRNMERGLPTYDNLVTFREKSGFYKDGNRYAPYQSHPKNTDKSGWVPIILGGLALLIKPLLIIGIPALLIWGYFWLKKRAAQRQAATLIGGSPDNTSEAETPPDEGS